MKQLSTNRWVRMVGGVALAAGLYGLVEGLVLVAGTRSLVVGPLGVLLGSVVSAVVLGVLCSAPLLAVAQRRRDGGEQWAGFAAAMLVFLTLEMALIAFTDPTPGQQRSLFQHPVWLAGLALVWVKFLSSGLPVKRNLSAAFALAAILPLTRWDTGPTPAAEVAESKQLTRLPNLLMVTLDTTRADRLGAYGYERAQTPAFDGLADRGILFEEAFSQIALTGPSHLGLFTGTGPWRHGNLLNAVPLPEDRPLLSETLSDAGYATGGFVSAYVLNSDFGFDRGFQVYDDVGGVEAPLLSRLRAVWERRTNPHGVVERRGDRTVDLALDWLGDQESSRPWMMWVHLFDAHGPYEPPAPFDTAFYTGDPRAAEHTSMDQVEGVADYLKESLVGIRDVDWVLAQYDGEIAFADLQLQRLLDAVEARGESQDTVVVVTADHGESLGDNGVWFDHGDDLYQASTQVPLVLSWPGQLAKGRRAKGPVELTDVLPTVLELMRLPVPEDIDGVSLMGTWITAHEREHARGLCFDREANLQAKAAGEIERPTYRMSSIRTADMLYVHRESDAYGDELYALDALEENRLGLVQEDEFGQRITEFLQEQSEGLLSDGKEGIERSTVPLSPAAKARLRALGYID